MGPVPTESCSPQSVDSPNPTPLAAEFATSVQSEATKRMLTLGVDLVPLGLLLELAVTWLASFLSVVGRRPPNPPSGAFAFAGAVRRAYHPLTMRTVTPSTVTGRIAIKTDVSAQFAKKVRDAAAREDRTVSYFVRRALVDALDKPKEPTDG
jgi:hypothetical protein